LPILEYDYLLTFKQEPPPVILRNNQSAFEHTDFVNRAIADLVYTGVVSEIDIVPKVVNPFSVSVNSSGKERLILDLRHVNKYLKLTTFKYECVKEAKVYAANKRYAFKFYLRHGYHHLDMHVASQDYIGVSWKTVNKVNYYIFTCLPFGLSSACYIFTKVVRPLVKFWRSKGFLIVVYLDDGLVFEDFEESCFNVSIEALSDLLSAVFFTKL
jgi:hypothetical protein